MKSPFCPGKSSRERLGDALLREPGDDPADRVPGRRRIEIRQDDHDVAGSGVPLQTGVDARRPAGDAHSIGDIREIEFSGPEGFDVFEHVRGGGVSAASRTPPPGEGLVVDDAAFSGAPFPCIAQGAVGHTLVRFPGIRVGQAGRNGSG